MPVKNRTKLTYNDRVGDAIPRGPGMRDLMLDIAEDIADDARPRAPRAAGKGHARGQHARDLIRGQVILTPRGWEGRVGWPRSAYYLLMHERGWKYRTARPFLRPAVQRRRDV